MKRILPHCCFTLLLVSAVAFAQVTPVQRRSGGGSGVQPLPSKPRTGSVVPLPDDIVDPSCKKILGIGVARIFNGDVAAARTAALRAAYADAVSRGVGISVGSLTIISNMKAVSDVVSTRSRGFIKSYEIIREGIQAGSTDVYEVRIEAQVVVQGSATDVEESEGLRLYLEILGNPELLIILPQVDVSMSPNGSSGSTEEVQIEYRGRDSQLDVRTRTDTSSTTTGGASSPYAANPAGQFTGVESALAQAFSARGYQVQTSDDVAARGLVDPETLKRARMGVTDDALAVARAAGADLALIGVMRVSSRSIRPKGVDFYSVTGEASAKALVVSSGLLVEAFHRTTTRAHPDALGANAAVMDRIAKDFADTLAWKIPNILVNNKRETRLIIEGVTVDDLELIKQDLSDLPEVEAVRYSRLPGEGRTEGELLLLTGFLRIDQYVIYEAAKDVLGYGRDVSVVYADKYEVRLRVG